MRYKCITLFFPALMIYICLEIQFIALNKTTFCQQLLLFELMV